MTARSSPAAGESKPVPAGLLAQFQSAVVSTPASRDIVAGTAAGIVSVLACHPLDTVRVRLQTAPTGRFSGGIDVLRQTIANEVSTSKGAFMCLRESLPMLSFLVAV